MHLVQVFGWFLGVEGSHLGAIALLATNKILLIRVRDMSYFIAG